MRAIDSFKLDFGGQSVEINGRESAAPVWLVLSSFELNDVKNQIDLAFKNAEYLSRKWDIDFLADLKSKFDSGDFRLSHRQRENLDRVTAEAIPKVGDPQKIAIVSTFINRFEKDMSDVEFGIKELQNRKQQLFHQTTQGIKDLAGSLEVEDFAESLVEIYRKFPTVKVSELLSLFGGGLNSIRGVPQRYLKTFSSGVNCKFCHGDILLGPLREDGKDAVESATCPECHKMRVLGAEFHKDGRVTLHESGKPVETYCSIAHYKQHRSDEEQRAQALAQSYSVIAATRNKSLSDMTYTDYLQTLEWSHIRGAALARAGYKCQTCAATGCLHVHHNNYPPFGTESARDLCVLCEACHLKFHDVVAFKHQEKRQHEAKLSKRTENARSVTRKSPPLDTTKQKIEKGASKHKRQLTKRRAGGETLT